MIFFTMMPDWMESSVLRSYSVRELIQLPSIDNYPKCWEMYWIWSTDCWAQWTSARFLSHGRSTWLAVWVTLRTSDDNPFENLQFKIFITTNEILLGFRLLQTVKKCQKMQIFPQKSQIMNRWISYKIVEWLWKWIWGGKHCIWDDCFCWFFSGSMPYQHSIIINLSFLFRVSQIVVVEIPLWMHIAQWIHPWKWKASPRVRSPKIIPKNTLGKQLSNGRFWVWTGIRWRRSYCEVSGAFLIRSNATFLIWLVR